MNLDFSALLVGLAFFTGGIWAIDVLMFAPKRRARAEQYKAEVGANFSDKTVKEKYDSILSESRLVEYAHSFFPVIFVVLFLRSFLVEPFRIPSNSMMPTLLTGDFILVNKFKYGVKLPVINTRIIEMDKPVAGDVVVFRYPKNPSIDYIKRVVGVPGDRIIYKNKKVYINGEVVKQDFKGTYEGIGSGIMMTGSNLMEEHLGKVDHAILVDSRMMQEMSFEVPQGEYFVMGDNRDNSNDSRFWGTVPEKNLVGKAFMIWMNWDSAGDGMAWNRVGTQIK